MPLKRCGFTVTFRVDLRRSKCLKNHFILQVLSCGALRNELDSIERDTANLIKQMQKAIAEANAFIDSMKS